MALNPVTLLESLRAWRSAGVTHLFIEGGFAEDACMAEHEARELERSKATWHERTQAADGLVKGQQPSALFSAQGQSNERGASLSAALGTSPRSALVSHVDAASAPASVQKRAPVAASSVAPAPVGAGSMAAGRRQAAANAVHMPAATNTVAPAPLSTPLALSDWAAPWQEVYRPLRPAPLLWTYAALGNDLTGGSAPERSALLRTVIGQLDLPKGSSVFWPFTLPTAPAHYDTEGNTYFAAGVGLLSPQLIIVIGPSCVPDLGLGLDMRIPFTQELVAGKLVLLLPEVDSLLQDGSLVARTTAFLQMRLKAIPALLLHKDTL